MTKLHSIENFYEWNKNAGYGTKLHLIAIKKFGVTKHHRKTFSPINHKLNLPKKVMLQKR